MQYLAQREAEIQNIKQADREYARSRKKPCKSLLNEVALRLPRKISEMITKKVSFRQHPKVVHTTLIQGPKGKLVMILSISS